MGKLLGFEDGKSECWSRVKLEGGELVRINVTNAGVVVKKSHPFLPGEKLYRRSGADEAVITAGLLHAKIKTYSASVGLLNPVLKVFTQVALDSTSTSDLEKRLARGTEPEENIKCFSNGDRRNAMRYQQIIDDYGRFIEDNPPNGEIRSTSELPHSKDEILEAITFQIVWEKKTTNLKTLKLCALMLADFQEEEGLKPKNPKGFDGFEFLSDFPTEEETLIKRASRIAYNNGWKKSKSVREHADQNLLQIENKLMIAEALRHKLIQAG